MRTVEEDELMWRWIETWPPDPLGPRNPFQVFVLMACALNGMAFVLGQPTSGAIEEVLPQPLVWAWGLMLLLGSCGTLAGMYWHGDPGDAFLIKRAGLTGLAVSAATLSPTLIAYAGWRGVLLSTITLAFALACWVQRTRLNRHLRATLHRVEEIREEEEEEGAG